MCPFQFETNLYSWNVVMIIWSANKAGYIIPGLWSTADSSHNAVAHNETGLSFFSLLLTKLYEHQRELALFQKQLFCPCLKLFIRLDILLITLT